MCSHGVHTEQQCSESHQLVLHADVHLSPALCFRPAVDGEWHLRLVCGVQAPAKHAHLVVHLLRMVAHCALREVAP